MSETLLTSYEDVPYEAKPLYPTHPDCLASVATLLGMEPAPVNRCRVLELGCATGGNLIGMAEALPDSRFVGVDLSPRQIANGQAVVDDLGLKNIELHARSIMDVDETWGTFDYILCHGVYSWVPAAVQDKILDLCARQLNPQGVAYISYNTYPGWHGRAMVREMMGYHAQQFADPATRVQQARAFLEFVTGAVHEPDSAYGKTLKEESELLSPVADYYLFHEHLEDFNQPLYFHQFAERAQAKQLQYLAESWFHTNLSSFPPQVQETIQAISGDLIHLEQYIDFLINRTFRRTLLCHQQVKINRTPSLEIVSRMHMTALAQPVSAQPDVLSTATETFRGDDRRTVSTNQPLIKAALVTLFDAWPSAMSFDALWQAVVARLSGTDQDLGPQARAVLAESLMNCYLSNMLALHVYPPRFARDASPFPTARPLARHQARAGVPITNLRHRIARLTDADRVVLPHLDGTRGRADLLPLLAAAVDTQSLTIPELAGLDGADRSRVLAEQLDLSLTHLARSALLTS